MADPISDYYGSEPWSAIDNKQRDWYVPQLLWAFKQRSTYGAMVPVKVDFNAVHTETIKFTGLWELEPNWNPLTTRQIWLETMHPATWRQELTMRHFGGKMAIHKYDPIITFWEANGKQPGQLAPLAQGLVANAIIDQIEIQIRNAWQDAPIRYFSDGSGGTSGTGFSDIIATDVYHPDIMFELNLEFDYSEIYNPQSAGLQAVAYCSPAQCYSARVAGTSEWKSAHEYMGSRALLNYEVGDFAGVAHIKHPINTLYNHGTLTAHVAVTSAINPGDGAADPSDTLVHGVKSVGESSITGNRYIQLGALEASWDVGWDTDLATTMAACFSVGDIITIHTQESPGTTDPFDVEFAPLPTDGLITVRQVVEVDTTNGRLVLDRPVQKDYTTEGQDDCDAGQYAFVSKGLHIHQAVVAAAPGAVVGGFAVPPKIMFPPAIDDVLGMYRITWDGYYDYKLFRPEVSAIIYSAGPVSKMGYKGTGA